MDAVAVLAGAVAVDLTTADTAAVKGVLAGSARVRRFLDGLDAACARRLRELADQTGGGFPEHDIADAQRTNLSAGSKLTDRAGTTSTIPELGDGMHHGEVSADHVDAVTAALRALTPEQQLLLAGHGQRLLELAARLTTSQFRREIAKLVHQLQTDDGVAQLEQQKRATRLRTWTDPATGMVRLSGDFDPETGKTLLDALRGAVEQLFHDRTPEFCPTDPVLKQDFLRAHALMHLITHGGEVQIVSMITLDAQTFIHGHHPNSRVDLGAEGLSLPLDTIRRMVMIGEIIPVLLDDNGVVVKLGRSQRIANRHQRRAARAMYRTCAIPSCARHIDDCELHHLVFWENGGPTDLDNLLPICKHHHDLIHTGQWIVTMTPDRSITIHLPDGTTMTTGPPKQQWE